MNIKKVDQISTKAGDSGTSRDYSNREFKKSNILFETLGTVDELSSSLGIAYHHSKFEDIKVIQKVLQDLNSLVATDPESSRYKELSSLNNDMVFWLETKMQMLLDIKPLEPRFTLPGSDKSLQGAYFDMARSISRRAERRLNEFIEIQKRTDLVIAQSYLNRLSDYLYILSCNL